LARPTALTSAAFAAPVLEMNSASPSVVEKALDALFDQIAKEEANIRANPLARTTEILKKVFGTR